MKVLVVDDSVNDRQVVRQNFESHGWQVVEAPNGRQGLELALAEKPDLIVSDCLMPVMDGFELLFELKKHDRARSTPFIFYSAVHTGTREYELAAALGAKAFIEKPRTAEQLWADVERLLDARSPAGEGDADPAAHEEYIRNYCHAAAVTLEEKVQELSEANENLVRLKSELERRVAERTVQMEAASRELDEFSYSVSHDLRAPLRHIDGFSQALADDHAETLDKMGKEYLDRVRKSTKRMIEMMDALLQLSRLSRGDLVKESLDITAMAKDVVAELSRSQPERKVRAEIAEGMFAEGDARLIKVVLEHLIGNAWKFSADKEEAVIEFSPAELDGRPAFAVRDNGVGFDAGYTDKLFSPFQRLHAQQEFPGLGVGLAAVKKIVSRHGGKVQAYSEIGKGATVTFTLG